MITLEIQRLELNDDNSVGGITGNNDRIYINALDIMSEVVKYIDPADGQTKAISIAALSSALKTFSNERVAKELNCDIDPETGWPINCSD